MTLGVKTLLGIIFVGSLALHSLTYRYLVEAEHKVEQLEKTLEAVSTELANTAKERLILERKNSEVELKAKKYQNELISYRDRESVVLAKPGLVELKLNKSFDKTQKELSCMTGGLCD